MCVGSKLTLALEDEFPRKVCLLSQVVHSPAGAISATETIHFKQNQHNVSLFLSLSYFRLEYAISWSPSAVGVSMALPIFMLALWLMGIGGKSNHIPLSCPLQKTALIRLHHLLIPVCRSHRKFKP